jgi:hypothetical protein
LNASQSNPQRHDSALPLIAESVTSCADPFRTSTIASFRNMSVQDATIDHDIPLWRAAEVRIGITVWASFIAATCAYCLVYQAFVGSVTPDVNRTITVALREWGVWLLITPWAFRELARQAHLVRWPTQLSRCISLALLAAAVPTWIDQFTHARGVTSSLAIFVPRYLLTAVVVYLIWRVVLDDTPLRQAGPAATQKAMEPARVNNLLVAKGADQCLIEIEDIQYLSAAGNYVDIHARDQSYVTRATMSQLERMLPADEFLRIHRSHIVRIEQIDRIKVQRSGSGTVHLRCGAKLPISRTCRAQLQQHRPDTLERLQS